MEKELKYIEIQSKNLQENKIIDENKKLIENSISEIIKYLKDKYKKKKLAKEINNIIEENIVYNKILFNKTIIIYPHSYFNLLDGGVTVQYYLAHVLNNMGIDVKICNIYSGNAKNILCNNFITLEEVNNIDKENMIVIYCEGVIGNPLNSKYVIRWILSKLGQNVPYERHLTWNKNELLYFFNSEIDIIDNNFGIKYLSLFYINSDFKNMNKYRKGECFTIRKKIFNHTKKLHGPNAREIVRGDNHNNYIIFFNIYEYFISYDPISFLTIIAALCGCISIVCPIDGISKKDYFKMTALYDYMKEKNLESIYGIAYGNSVEEIEYARNTMHLLRDQIFDIRDWMIKKYVKNFIDDLNNFENNENTLFNYINMKKR